MGMGMGMGGFEGGGGGGGGLGGWKDGVMGAVYEGNVRYVYLGKGCREDTMAGS